MVLYRMLLTREGIAVKRTVLGIIQRISTASLEHIEREAQKDADLSCAEDDISQGKSVAFSLLEIAMFVVAKYAPDLIPAANKKPKTLSAKRTHLGNYIQNIHILFSLDHLFEQFGDKNILQNFWNKSSLCIDKRKF